MTDKKTPVLKKRQIFASVAGAALGVRGNDARERDFQHGKPSSFIIGGLIFTLGFVISLVLVVKLVLATTTH